MMMAEATPPHVVFLPLPTRGHTIPAMQFAQTLAAEGFIVSFLCAEHLLTRFRRALENSPAIRLLALPQHILLPTEHTVDRDLGDRLIRLLRVMEDIIPVLEQTLERLVLDSKKGSLPPPLCIISDCFISGTQDVANKFNIPRYVFCPISSSGLANIWYIFPRLAVEKGLAFNAEVLPAALSWLLKSSDSPQDWQRERSPTEWGKHICKTFLRLQESSGIVINTFHALEAEILDALTTSEAINHSKVPIYPVGPLLPSKFFRNELVDQEAGSDCYNEALQWLNKQTASSVLYIAFGSIVILSVRQIQEIAKALEACKQAFLWILRLPSSAQEDAVLPKGFVTESHGLVISTIAPQLLILSHPSVGGFMSHCGWNSTMESTCSGVPMLTLPQFGDQFLNSRMVTEQLKVGVEASRGADGVAESEEIETGIKKLMQGAEGEGMRRRAKRLREDAARSVSQGGSSISCIRSFMDAVAALQV